MNKNILSTLLASAVLAGLPSQASASLSKDEVSTWCQAVSSYSDFAFNSREKNVGIEDALAATREMVRISKVTEDIDSSTSVLLDGFQRQIFLGVYGHPNWDQEDAYNKSYAWCTDALSSLQHLIADHSESCKKESNFLVYINRLKAKGYSHTESRTHMTYQLSQYIDPHTSEFSNKQAQAFDSIDLIYSTNVGDNRLYKDSYDICMESLVEGFSHE
ncbi:hypothetical protein [Neptuniibacter sp. QD37_11]|uniref:hypothetical protein n=1 Tax=Neptuniibacter sp. QD37_11 TaxID=3398209 RepID=UPI0039F50ADB